MKKISDLLTIIAIIIAVLCIIGKLNFKILVLLGILIFICEKRKI